MPEAAKARAPNLPTKDSKVVKWTHWALKKKMTQGWVVNGESPR
jgi:hypothetical protein